jgi:hypothetical protein
MDLWSLVNVNEVQCTFAGLPLPAVLRQAAILDEFHGRAAFGSVPMRSRTVC